MLFRNLHAELYDFFSRPLQWLAIIFVSLIILVGVDQLALDKSIINVLIVDVSPDQSEGQHISDLIAELSAIRPTLANTALTYDQAVAGSQADIVLHKLNDLWRATLRPRSILDHRRLARAAFSLAEVVNHIGPWDTVISADSMSRRNYQSMICDIGERMCSLLQSVGDAHYKDQCLPPSKSNQQADESVKPDEASPDDKQDKTSDGTAGNKMEDGSDEDPDDKKDDSSDDGDNRQKACPKNMRPVLADARSLATSLGAFCDPERIDPDRSKGICISEKSPTLASVVSMIASPQSHTRVFIARTICLLSVFLAFVLCCRSWIQETRYNTWQVAGAILHGDIRYLVIGKIITTTVFCLLLSLILLEFSAWQFGLLLKPGILIGLLSVLLAALSSAMLGLSVALVVRNEASVYIAASLYLLILFVLCGYIDDLKDTSFIISAISYAMPLTYLVSPFEAWMTFGTTSRLTDNIVPLLSQCTSSFILLLLAKLIHQRRS